MRARSNPNIERRVSREFLIHMCHRSVNETHLERHTQSTIERVNLKAYSGYLDAS